MTTPYVLATCKPQTLSVFDDAGRVLPERVEHNIADYCTRIRRAADEHGARLIAFPQFGLSGHAMVGNDQWVAAALDFDGPEIERIARAARDADAYVVLQAAERHAAFPNSYFLSSALLTPAGNVGMVYRKHYTLSLRTSPIDVHDAFVATFGRDAFFPVLDTPIGCIGLTIGAEVHWPEVTHSLALNGAEIIVNPIASPVSLDYLERAGAEHVRGVRAFENMTYLAVANMAAPAAPPSKIYDYAGASIGSEADGGFTLATIDLAALRAARGAPAANLLAEIQPDIHAPLESFALWPRHAQPPPPARSFGDLVAIETASWRRLRARTETAHSQRVSSPGDLNPISGLG